MRALVTHGGDGVDGSFDEMVENWERIALRKNGDLAS